MADYRQRLTDLQQRARARLETAVAERAARWAGQSGLPPGEDAPQPFSPKGLQGPEVFHRPDDSWTSWEVCPSTGGRTGQRYSALARHNADLRLMDVQFASGGTSGTGNIYRYQGISELEYVNLLSGRLGGGRTFPVLDSRSGQQLWSGHKIG